MPFNIVSRVRNSQDSSDIFVNENQIETKIIIFSLAKTIVKMKIIIRTKTK